MRLIRPAIISLLLLIAIALSAQDVSLPHLIRYSGTISPTQQQPGAVLGATFLIYKDSAGGAPLWMETQNIRPDSDGRYTVLLGGEHAEGIPQELFRSGDARWITMQLEGQAEGERIQLVSVPYAMEAYDASALAGHPLSDFVLADQLRAWESLWTAERIGTQPAGAFSAGSTDQATIVSSGTANALAKFTDADNVGASGVYENGGKLGIGTTTPTAGVHIAAALPRSFIQATTPGNNAGLWFESRPPDTKLAAKRGGVYFSAGNTPQNTFVGFTGDDLSYHMVATQAGNVGVGTTAPLERFHVSAPIARAFVQSTSAGKSSGFRLGGLSSTSVAHAGAIYFQAGDTPAATFIALSADDTNYHAVVTSAGNVGIGTTTPAGKLDVAGTLRLSNGGVLYFDDGTMQSTAAGPNSISAGDGSVTVATVGANTSLSVADLGVTNAKLADGSVTTAKIADASISMAKLQPSVLSAMTPADGSITTAKLADASISMAKLQPSVVSAMAPADGSITNAKLADGSVTTLKIADASISAAKLQPSVLSAMAPADGSITTAKIADASISMAKLQPSVLSAMTPADGSITTAKIADASISVAKLQPSVLSAMTPADGSITTAKLADASISMAKLQPSVLSAMTPADGSITTAKIADASVTTLKIADVSISMAKLQPSVVSALTPADGSITNAKLADGSVTTLKIADASISAAKLQPSVLSAMTPADGSITTAKITDGAITASKIAAGAITPASIVGIAATIGSNVFSGAQAINGTLATSNTAASPAITAINTSDTNAAVLARNTSLSGPAYGTRSETQSVTGIASYGYASANTGFTRGFQGRVDSTDGTALEGIAYAGSGNTVAIHGITYSASAKALLAESTASSGTNYGVYATAGGGANTAAVFASATNNTPALTYGVYAKSAATLGVGVLGYSTATSGTTSGVYGRVDSASGSAGEFDNGAGGNVFIGRSRTLKVARIDGTGKLFVNGGTQTGGADFAESVRVRGSRSEYGPGDVLVVDLDHDRQILLSSSSYATTVAGIYSTKPGVLATPHEMDSPEFAQEIPLAMVGIVPCKASAENGAIRRGDLLVTSSKPGHVMRGTDRSRMLGAIVGKALQPLESGTGLIECMVTLQ